MARRESVPPATWLTTGRAQGTSGVGSGVLYPSKLQNNRDEEGQMPDQTNQTTPVDENTAAALGEQVKDVGAKMMDVAREKVRSGFEKQQRRAADEISGVAGALHDAADRLQADNHGGTAHYVKVAADQATRLADQVRDHGLDDLVSRAEGLARRQPELFVGGALLAGMAIGRFLKASSNHRRMAGDIDLATRRHRAPVPADPAPPAGEMPTRDRSDYTSTGTTASAAQATP
jgi:hypothetical protein